ncbi:37525_t:CDS:10, partial [Gigaspora margarita]
PPLSPILPVSSVSPMLIGDLECFRNFKNNTPDLIFVLTKFRDTYFFSWINRMASSDTQIGVNKIQPKVSSTTNQNTSPTHDVGLGKVKKLNKDAILSDTSLVGDSNPDNLENSSNSVQILCYLHGGIPDNVKKSNFVISSNNKSLIHYDVSQGNTLVDGVPSSIEMTLDDLMVLDEDPMVVDEDPMVVAETINDSSSSIIISRTAGTHSTSANSPIVSSMIVSSESSKHSRSGSRMRKKGPPLIFPSKFEKVVGWKSQKKENDLPKQNPEAPLKNVPRSNQLEELQDQNNTRLKNKVPPDTLQEINNSSEVLFKEVEIKDKMEISSRNSSYTIPEVKETNSFEIDLSKQQPKTFTDSYQTIPEEIMTLESIYEHLAKKGIVDNNSPPAIPPNVSTSNEIQSEVMNFDDIHKRFGLSGSQSTPIPFPPNNNLPDTPTSQTSASEDENTKTFTDDKTNSLVITSQFSIGTDKNPPLINNEFSNPAIMSVGDTSTFQSSTIKDNNASPLTDDKTNSLVITASKLTSQFSIGTEMLNSGKNIIGGTIGTISRILGNVDKYTECVQITFYVHLPPHTERFGEPVIVGSCKELGSWKMITILLTQPHKREHPTYWRSHPVEIQLGRDEIKYNYGVFNRGCGRIEFEGEDERQNRTLDTRTNDQYDIWQNNKLLHIFNLNEFAFIKCIYDAVNNENLKDKVMQFQLLLTNHRTHALNFITLDFITQRYQKKEKRLFLCVLLGYFINFRKDPRVFTFQLPKQFRSELLLEALEHVQQDTFTSDIKPIMAPVVAALVRHNVMEMISFEWLRIFRVAQFVDPEYTFVDGFIDAHYGKEQISRLLKEWPKIVRPHLDQMDERIYIRISKWLISCCSNMETLNLIWRDNIEHTLCIDNEIATDFSRNVYTIIAQDNTASALYANFIKVIPEFRILVASLFRDQIITLLKNQQGDWDQQNLQALGKLLKDGNLYSEREYFIRTLECVSQSTIYNLLKVFPELLEYWLNSKFSNSRSQEVLKICQQWFTRIISNLNYNYNMSLNEGGRFIYNVYECLTRIQSLLTERSNIYKELLHAASERIKKCSHNHILFATVQIAKFNKSITNQFYNLVTENVLVAKEIRRIDKNLIEMICLICGQNKVNLEILDVPNSISENLLCHILTCLEIQTPQIYATDQQLDLIKHTDFWRMIFDAKNNVTILQKHSHVMKIRTAISNLASAIVDKTIDIKTLQAILSKCCDEQLYKCLHVVNTPNAKKTFQSVVIAESNISAIRKECNAYEERLRHLKAFYSTFCSPNIIVDSDIYTRDLEAKLKILSNVSLNETLSPHYWERHEDVIQKAADIYEFANSKTFINIYETHLSQITDEVNVNYVINDLVPAVSDEHTKTFKNYKEKKWMQVKYSEAFPLWKGVTDIKTELELISKVTYLSKSNKDLEISLKHLTAIPKWEERLQKLSAVVEIFKVPIKTDDWLGRSLKIIRDDMLILGKVAEFVTYVNDHNPINNENYWSLIKELASASDLLDFLQTIAEHDIKNLINGVDDFSDERLIQEDTMSSLIQVKQLVMQLMNKASKIGEFLKVIQKISQETPYLPNKITVCAGFNMALQNMLRNISNRGEVTKEKIQNAVLIGTYTFEKVDKSDKFNVTLVYQAKGANKIKHNMTDLQDLRGRALLIAKHANMNSDLTEEDKSSKIMNEFVLQVDTAQEILNAGSKLIQMGHFDYRQFKKEIVGTEKRVGTIEMRNLLAKFKEDLQLWKKVIDKAQEQHYYLTFFPARHILAFYDYFTSDVQDDENAEICRTFIKFVNSKAELPSQKDRSGISRKNTDYSRTLKEIGEKLNTIFGKLLKTSRELKVRGERIIADVVDRGKLCIASCNDKLRVPNIIMSLYANHKTYPEPWQVLICTKSTTIEELNIFIKRCFFAAKNRYKEKLFCIANLELLEFELQYGLVESIRSMRERHNDYLLALVCCCEGSFHHHILDQFSQDVHSTNGLNAETMKTIYRDLCSNVVCVSSDLSGQGKTEWIKQASFEKKKLLRSFLISDGADFGSLVRQLRKCKLQPFESLHINIISADNSNEINMFLFELLTLGFVSSNVDIASFSQTSAFIEVASTVQQKLLNSLPITGYLVKEHLSWDIRRLNVSSELHGPIQIVCNYLDTYDRNGLYGQNCIKKPLPDQRCRDLIAKYFFEGNADGVSSFRFVEIFVNVLADQLTRLSSSAYFTVGNLIIKDETTLGTTLLESISDDYYAKFEIVQWDASKHLLVFFMSQNSDSIGVPDNVKEFLRSQYMAGPSKWELKDYNQMPSNLSLERLECLARRTMYLLDLPLYALSADNTIKMALILLRARANVPVIVMGEAGCGKSSLIGFLAKVVEVNYEPFNLHAGIKEQDILDFMDKAQKKADNGELWLFFDEINTCNHIGLLANLIAHRTLQGKLVHPNIRLFSACNPYRKKAKAQSQAGIKTRVRRYEEQSNLVYQVKPLPDQILDYIWDYGVLSPNDEKKYIQVMVQTRFGEGHDLFTELLFSSQQFIRSIEEKYSVSLRDIKRAIKLVDFFNESVRSRHSRNRQYPPNPDNPGRIDFSIRCYILALSLCYQSRIYDQESRNEYRKEMLKIFQRYKTGIKESDFIKVIRDEQEDWVRRMQLPPNTAMNEALLENVLAMIVCILTKIPVFIVGAPGSSKSLAIKLVGQNLRGCDSNDRYFRKLPQAYLISYQGSSSSTSDGIIKVFETANKHQETSSKEFPVISVVVLDIVGLAETSPHNPLKVLHALLEPNYPSDGPSVSVVGISKWRLDNSKSSRALLVQRPKFGINDLVDTAVRLLDSKLHNSITRSSLRPLAEAYSEYEGCGQSHSNFHGLRDYYGL